MNILERIQQVAIAAPAHIAQISGGERLTYGELWRRSDELAAYFRQALPADHRPIGVRGHKETGMLVTFLAAVKAGHPYLPLDRSIPPERVARIAKAADVALMVEAGDVTGLAAAADPVASATWVGADDPFYLIYTSGSTGEPKGVPITRGCLDSFVDWMLHEQGFAPRGETFLNQAPFSFDLSVMDTYLSLATGGTLFSLTKEMIAVPKRLFATLAESEATVWVSTPSFAVMCLAEPTFGRQMLPKLNRFLFCGEALPHEAAARLLERFPGAEVWNTYGPTEATVATTSVRVDQALLDRYNPLPVGRPKSDSRILVVDESGHPVPEGERGEILIAGPNVSPGYLNRPSPAFCRLDGQRAYRTGDWGRHRDGLLFCEGRMDFQIKLHGYRIELGDIESHLRGLPGVADAVVLPYLREGRAEWLAAFLVWAERPEGSDFALSQRLRQGLGEHLPAYMLPRKFFFLERFPMTANGKADRKQLGAMLT